MILEKPQKILTPLTYLDSQFHISSTLHDVSALLEVLINSLLLEEDSSKQSWKKISRQNLESPKRPKKI